MRLFTKDVSGRRVLRIGTRKIGLKSKRFRGVHIYARYWNRSDGQIDAAQAERVRDIGRWLSTNGESIYGTRGGPWLPGSYGVSTHNQSVIYVHLLQAPEIRSSRYLRSRFVLRMLRCCMGSALQFKQSDRELVIQLPAVSIDAIDRAQAGD
jgi:hypothetical protein